MDFDELQRSWQHLGSTDPRWAILSEPGRKGGGGDDASFWQSGVGFIGWLAQHLNGLGALPQRDRALDFGCGHGRLTQALAPHFASVVGVDIAESMLAAAQVANRHGERVTYVHNARPDLSLFADASFDFVLSMIVLQHMRNEYSSPYLREFLRVLRPGGIAFFQLPVESLTPPPAPDRVATAAPERLASAALCASTAILPSRLAFVADRWQWARLTVHNTGPHRLHALAGPGATEIGLRFQRLDYVSVGPPVWVPLSHDLGPGERAEAVVAVRAPVVHGTYVLGALPGVDRVWCEHPLNAVASLPVRVQAAGEAAVPAAPPPRPRFQDQARRQSGPIEVHGTPLADVEQIVRQAGGELVDVGLDGWAGYEWISAHFTVRKR